MVLALVYKYKLQWLEKEGKWRLPWYCFSLSSAQNLQKVILTILVSMNFSFVFNSIPPTPPPTPPTPFTFIWKQEYF
jgi:hypothetical protein